MTIAAVETALVQLAQTTVGQYVRTVDALPGALTPELLTLVSVKLPACLWAYLGGANADPRANDEVIDARWVCYAVTAHSGDRATRRVGDAVEIGAYEIIERMVPAVRLASIANVGSVRLVRVDNLWAPAVERRGLAIFAATFSMPMAFEVAADLATLDAFVTFHADYDIEPHASSAQRIDWLAEPPNYTESVPDAQDQVILEQ